MKFWERDSFKIKVPVNGKLSDVNLFQAAKGSDKKTSFLDILLGILFSAVISLIPALAAFVYSVIRNPDISLRTAAIVFFITLGIFTILLFLFRFFVKNFSKIFSLIFMCLFLLFIFSFFIFNSISASVCIYYDGKWKRIPSPIPRRYDHVCVLSQEKYNAVPTKSILHHWLNNIEISN